jgi:hypothetical protein
MATPNPGPDPADAARQAQDAVIRNEKRKLAAIALNNIAVATVVAGLVAPVIALGHQFSAPMVDTGSPYWSSG